MLVPGSAAATDSARQESFSTLPNLPRRDASISKGPPVKPVLLSVRRYIDSPLNSSILQSPPPVLNTCIACLKWLRRKI